MSCDKNLTLEECELFILRTSVDNIEKKLGKKKVGDPQTKEIINIIEGFLKRKKLICYGGTAINNLLPKQERFYDDEVDLPDYDFFSPDALNDAKELADLYFSNGFTEIQATAGVHKGTFKVFVNFLPIADITQTVPELFNSLKKTSVKVNGILYTPPNYLRMLMYLELSRPLGDPSRWEKVLKRLTLLNKYYPLKGDNCDYHKIHEIFDMEEDATDAISIIRKTLIDQKVVFFGALANSLYLKKLPKFKKYNIQDIPRFDALSGKPKTVSNIIKKKLTNAGINDVTIEKKMGIGEVIAPNYEIKVGNNLLASIYIPIACHNYNVIKVNKKKIRIATIDTLLSLYLAFIYVNRDKYNPSRILCMSEYLFKVQQKNRVNQEGIFKRFGMQCYGKQHTIEDIRSEKSRKYKELRGDKTKTTEYEEYFLRYSPKDKQELSCKSNSKSAKKKCKEISNKTRKVRKSSLYVSNNTKKTRKSLWKRLGLF